MSFWPNSTGMIPVWSPTKLDQMVLIGCISKSRGQTLGFQNAIFKNLLVWKYKAQSSHSWCITSSRGPLPIFAWTTVVVLCKWLYCDLWPFPQISDPGAFGSSCFNTAIQNIKMICEFLNSYIRNNTNSLKGGIKTTCLF